jgi:hypothetical protein
MKKKVTKTTKAQTGTKAKGKTAPKAKAKAAGAR